LIPFSKGTISVLLDLSLGLIPRETDLGLHQLERLVDAPRVKRVDLASVDPLRPEVGQSILDSFRLIGG
jgi:hypothetical protein